MLFVTKMCSQNLQTFVLLLLAASPTHFSLPFMWLWHSREAFMYLHIITARLSTFRDFKDSRWTAGFWHPGPALNEGLHFLEAQITAGTANCCSVHIWAPQSSQKSRKFSGLKWGCVVSTRQPFADVLWLGLLCSVCLCHIPVPKEQVPGLLFASETLSQESHSGHSMMFCKDYSV